MDKAVKIMGEIRLRKENLLEVALIARNANRHRKVANRVNMTT